MSHDVSCPHVCLFEQANTYGRAMSQSIASLKNLKALRLVSRNTDHKNESLESLSQIKDLKHLGVENLGYYDLNKDNIVRSMLLNSSTTLQSLGIWTNSYGPGFIDSWEEVVSANPSLRNRKYTLVALKSLTLHGTSFTATLVTALQRAIDLLSLRDLSLDGNYLEFFLRQLADLAATSSNSGTAVGLQNLTLELGRPAHGMAAGQIPAKIAASSSFISAFDTLTSLEIKNFHHHQTIPVDALSTEALIQAIIKHKNLKTLRFSYAGTSHEYGGLFLRATSIAAIVNALPYLQLLEFAPQESEIVSLFHFLTTC